MRSVSILSILAVATAAQALAQNATVVVRTTAEGHTALGLTAVSVQKQGIQRLADDSGVIVLRGLAAGEIALRFRRIGFAPKDTTITATGSDTVRLSIEMRRLALDLPAVLVNGLCADRTPLEPQSPVLVELFDQVRQNAERLVLFATQRPFTVQWQEERGPRTDGGQRPATQTSTRGPLPDERYAPGRVQRRVGNVGVIKLPELADIADTAFTNNHCFWYAGQTRFGADSVIQVDFEPVPWLAKDVDLVGSVFLRVDTYRLVGMVTRLNRIPRDSPGVVAYSARARFEEIESGIPVLAEVEISNTFRGARQPTVVATGRMAGVRWLDASRRDTLRW